MATIARTDDIDMLTQAWSRPPGIVGWLSAVNHKAIGMRFIVTGMVFFVVGGVMALLIRTQLAVPENSFLSAEVYAEMFTMHGTTMMFLFAVPVLEGLAMYLLPLMLGTRDLPFPRLNAFGYWSYLFGGLFVFSGFVTGQVPDQGWFSYVPLASAFSGSQVDLWLLGVTFVEISGIVGALELIVVFFRRRAIGMSLNRVPVFAWAVLAMSAMMVVAFPVLVAASTLLEVERATGLAFYDPAAGGEPLLWQHLFWFFGHPEVYIMLLPAVGLVSMIVSVSARRPLAGYPWVVAAFLAIALASFGLWAHHMFTVGLPSVALGFFSAASVLIAIPSGVLVFAWLATMLDSKPARTTPLLYSIGFVVIFVIGGITGVMVAAVPFDWQVHDSFFVVAHFHYVLLGGVVFPVFAALYHWFPKFTGRRTSERLGRTAFWTMFIGTNVAFFPQHMLGLSGMPRRVFTYEVGLGWELGNLISTIGAFILAIGVAVAIVDFLTARRSDSAQDPWQAATLEWATTSPPPVYNFRRLPVVSSLDPQWDERDRADAPDWLLRLEDPDEPIREVVDTSPIDGLPESVEILPGPTLWPLAAAVAFLIALVGVLVGADLVATAGAVLIFATLVGWAGSDLGELPEPVIEPTSPGRSPVGIWGLWVGVVVLGSLLGALFFSYWYLGTRDGAGSHLGVDLVAVAVASVAAVVAAATAAAGHRASTNGPRETLSWGAGSFVSSAVFVATTAAVVAEMTPRAVGSGLASIEVALVAYASLLGVSSVGGAIAAGMQVARDPRWGARAMHALRNFTFSVVGAWALIVAALWIGSAALGTST